MCVSDLRERDAASPLFAAPGSQNTYKRTSATTRQRESPHPKKGAMRAKFLAWPSKQTLDSPRSNPGAQSYGRSAQRKLAWGVQRVHRAPQAAVQRVIAAAGAAACCTASGGSSAANS